MAGAHTGAGPRPRQLRLLWRMQRDRTCRRSRPHEHPGGTEALRVYFEPEERDEVLQIEVQRFEVAALEMKATALHDMLREKGWWPLKIGSPRFRFLFQKSCSNRRDCD